MEKYSPGRHPGATWRRIDFQIHTPRDANWSGSGPLPGRTEEETKARLGWAKQLVATCRARGLQAIAVTDHHDLCMLAPVRKAIRELDCENELWLFPGMEVTCDDACQALILLDVESTKSQRDRIFGTLPGIAPPDELAAQAPQAIQCGRQIEDFINAVANDKILWPVSIVLPHAGNEGSYKSVLRDKFNVRFRDLECDGVYTDKPYAALRPRTKSIVFGEQAEWGRRRRGLIPTGDNRKADFSDLGKSPCWIRLGEPTAEAIRQALLVDEARLCYEPPSIPGQRILEFRVFSTLTGEIELVVNDGFTAIIGGRGSGKSALLEYLRFGLGRSSLDVDTYSSEHERLKLMLRDTLRAGWVEVTLERDGVREIWRRTITNIDSIRVSVDGDGEEELSIPEAWERFRARAYEQKELSSILPAQRSAMEQITGIAAAELWKRRRASEAEIDRAKRDVRQAFARVVEFWRAEAELGRLSNRVADSRRRLDALGAELEERGLTPEDRGTLERAPAYTRGETFLEEATAALEDAKGEAERSR